MASTDDVPTDSTPLWVEEANEAQKNRTGGCPFKSGQGFCTVEGRQDWINAHGLNHISSTISTSVEADLDPSAPLYYWQIHSLLGPKRIELLVSRFYTSIYQDDKDPRFRDVFIRMNSLEHQIHKQTQFWIDVFGGGEVYLPGEFGVVYHHKQPLAKTVMNAAGATRWMYHMSKVLCELDFSDIDIRIKPCIIDFIRTKMKKYAKEFKWKYDEKDFDYILKNDPEMIRLTLKQISNLTYDIISNLTSEEIQHFLYFLDIDLPKSSSNNCLMTACFSCHNLNFCSNRNELINLLSETIEIQIEKDLELLSVLTKDEIDLFIENHNIDLKQDMLINHHHSQEENQDEKWGQPVISLENKIDIIRITLENKLKTFQKRKNGEKQIKKEYNKKSIYPET